MMRLVTSIMIGMAAIGVALLFILPPMPQPQWYHDFADQVPLLGIPNFWNVISNFPFLVIGGWGVLYLGSNKAKEGVLNANERRMYLVFFAAVTLTSVGSAYYHLKPNNERLVWDRLPIAITFMALFGIIISEYLSRRAGGLLFLPLLLLGAASVIYWDLAETWGRGDLRPYLLAQLYPALAIPVILLLMPGNYTGAEKLYAAIAWYAAAKLYEFLDKAIYAAGGIVSGHTLKHIAAAVSCYMILNWIQSRRKITATQPEVLEIGDVTDRPDNDIVHPKS